MSLNDAAMDPTEIEVIPEITQLDRIEFMLIELTQFMKETKGAIEAMESSPMLGMIGKLFGK